MPITTRRHRTLAAVGVAALAAAVLAGTGTAWAADAPIVGTTACTEAVEVSGAVAAARADLEQAQTDANTANAALAAAIRQGVTGADLDTARAKASQTAANVVGANGALATARKVAENRLCVPASSTPAPEPTTEAPNPEPTTVKPAPEPTTVVVVPAPAAVPVYVDQLADDGSTATTSGSQVTDVPSGSASTGAV